MGEISSITIKPLDRRHASRGYARLPVPDARLVVGHGIDGDAKGGSPGRHLNVMAAETVRQLATEGFKVALGQLGEQLVLNGVLEGFKDQS